MFSLRCMDVPKEEHLSPHPSAALLAHFILPHPVVRTKLLKDT